MADDQFLKTEWRAAHEALSIKPDWNEFDSIREAYSSEGRYYHTWWHIHDVCKFVRDHFGDQPLVILTLFYHDIIYDVTRKDNEKASAEAWERYAEKRGFESRIKQLVSDIIVMTETHVVREDQPIEFKVASDADMSVFVCEDDETYRAYARDVWREYQAVGQKAYVAGRLQFLGHLDFAKLFYTEPARALIQKAQERVKWEIDTLLNDPNSIIC